APVFIVGERRFQTLPIVLPPVGRAFGQERQVRETVRPELLQHRHVGVNCHPGSRIGGGAGGQESGQVSVERVGYGRGERPGVERREWSREGGVGSGGRDGEGKAGLAEGGRVLDVGAGG